MYINRLAHSGNAFTHVPTHTSVPKEATLTVVAFQLSVVKRDHFMLYDRRRYL